MAKNTRTKLSAQERSDAQMAASVIAQAAVDHHAAGRIAEAEALYRRALRLAPAEAETHYNHGVALLQLGRTQAAIDAWQTAVRLRPTAIKALNNLGSALAELDQLTEAETYLRAALRHDAFSAEAHNNLGIVLWGGDRLDEADLHIHRALALRPDYADAYNSLGVVRQQQGRIAEAGTAYRAALAISPQFPKAHFNLGLVLLAQGRLVEGWREHEWRWHGGARHLMAGRFAEPEWRGEPLAGRTLLLHAEQGFGDTLQFVRYATGTRNFGGPVILEVQKPLQRLLSTLPNVVQVVAAGERLPRFDCHLPLLSVPNIVGTTLESIPADVPYVCPPATVGAAWRKRLDAMPGLRVGLAWSGDPRHRDLKAHTIDRRRSIALACFAPLLAAAGPALSFVSLQKGSARRQLADLPATRRPTDFNDLLTDFAETAGLVANLDLVITVDTAIAHLAGAMGKPVWILSRFDGCWRWLQNRDDSPWYPTARLFRQTEPGRWDTVVQQVTQALAQWAEPP